MRVVAIIQARTSSHRLPGKIAMPLAGLPLISRVVERLKQARSVNQVVIATSTDASDDWLEKDLENEAVFRGPLQDVLLRYCQAAHSFKAELVIRVTGDNPLVEPGLVDQLVAAWHKTQADYISCAGCVPGVGSELFTRKALSRLEMDLETFVAHEKEAYAREHVTPGFYWNPDKFLLNKIILPPHLRNREGVSLTVDTKSDYEFMALLYDRFYQNGVMDLSRILADEPQSPAGRSSALTENLKT